MAAKKTAKGGGLRIGIDFTEVDEADDGDTTYGGTYRFDGTGFPASGDDRSDNHFSEVEAKLQEMCWTKWPKSKPFFEENEAFQEAVYEAVHEGAPDGSCDLFDIVIRKNGTRFSVSTEAFSSGSKQKVMEKLPPKVRAAKELGDLLGDLLANHVDEHEDELASGLAESVAGGDLEDAGLKPTEDVLNLALNEAMGYMREAMKPILRKALTDWSQG
jgi:hypothetical protein